MSDERIRQPLGRVKRCRKCGRPVIWLEKKNKSKGFPRVEVDPKTCESFDDKYDPKIHTRHKLSCPFGGKKWNFLK